MPSPSLLSPQQSLSREQVLHTALKASIVAGGDFIDTQIYCFSRRTHDGLVNRPRPIQANSYLLKATSSFFVSSLGGDWKAETLDQQSSTDCYEYDSDSDIEDDTENEVAYDDTGASQGHPASQEGPEKTTIEYSPGDGDRPGEVSSQSDTSQAPESSDSNTAIEAKAPVAGRRKTIFIKNVAYNTMLAFVFYAMTGEIEFSPIRSQNARRDANNATKSYESPRCSPKSMYRLAEMYGIPDLQALASKGLATKLSATNILAELFSTFTVWYPEVQKLELDFLVSNCWASTEVMNTIPIWMDKVARGNLPNSGAMMTSLLQLQLASVAKCPNGHVRASKQIHVKHQRNTYGQFTVFLQAWGTSAQMETFREEEREGRMTVVLGGKVLVIDVELSVNRSDPDCPMVTVAGLKTSYAIPNTASGSTTQGSLSLDGFLADRLQAFLTEVQKEPEEQDCLRAERFGRLFSEDLIYLMQLDQLALNEGDGGLRWFSDIDALAQETEKFAMMEAEAIVGCISRAFTHVAPSLFNWRIHIVFDTCLAASLSSPTTNMPPPFTCVSLTTGNLDDGRLPYLGPRFHRRWATLWHNYEPVANAGDRACGQSSEWDVTYRQHANDGIRVRELVRSITNPISPERYTTLYTSPTGAHPQLHLRLTAPDEPGFILEKVPVHTLKEIWGILEIVKEQCWLNEIISAYTWTPEGLNIGEGLGEDIDDSEATQDDLQAILKGMVEISVAFDPSRPRGVTLDVSGAMGADLNSDVLEEYLWWPDTALAADLWGESFSRALARFRPSSHPDIEKGLQELASVWELALGDLAKDHAKRLVDFKVMRA
ncbi:hypothetical protein IEO21_05044 [Rhodonia placenta]|uniref:Uncharacterized protein n=1 Tax=Rhodonia placenta TaxID=104341 RepID=A0A8H7U1Z9_9APHY|nr:hypothetical protein IEO21_05044 [Postia placenta]